MIYESGIAHEKIVASFCDISNDHPWTIQHVALLSKTVHPIETIYPVKGFFELAMEKKRFRSKPYVCEDGRKMNVATIDDVVKWSLTGKRAKGSWEDEPKQRNISCNSGYCE